MVPTNTSVAASIRAELARAGISRRQLARDLDVRATFLDRRLHPAATNPPPFTIEMLGRIARRLDIPVSRLLGEDDHAAAAG